MIKKLNPHISVDCVIFGFDSENMKILINETEMTKADKPNETILVRKLPGDMIYDNEDLQEAANRVLCELTGLDNIFLKQFHAFGAPNRIKTNENTWLEQQHDLEIDRVISIGFFSLIKIEKASQLSPNLSEVAHWVNLKDLGVMAFDHNEIMEKGLTALRKRMKDEPIGYEMLPKKFTIRQLQNLYEAVFNVELDSRNFRKKLANANYIVPLDEKEKNVSHKPAQLFKFDKRLYVKSRKANVVFTV